jgi:hypothetical protein
MSHSERGTLDDVGEAKTKEGVKAWDASSKAVS